MNFIILVLIIAVVFVGITQILNSIQIFRLRQRGVYPQAGQATMADVERLNKSGMQVWAIRCYREIHGCSLRQAKENVTRL